MKVIKTLKQYSLLTSSAIVILVSSSPVSAARCGGGKIIEIKEGGWNSDDFMIMVDYSDFTNQHPGTNFGGYIRYSAESLSSERLNAIRKLALTAMVSAKTVLTYSHNNSCSNATELTVYVAQ